MASSLYMFQCDPVYKWTTLSESFAILFILIFLTSMCTQMPILQPSLCQGLITLIALIWYGFFPCVCYHVICQFTAVWNFYHNRYIDMVPSPSVKVFGCFTRVLLWKNTVLHWLHWYSVSPVWVFWCLFSSTVLTKASSHCIDMMSPQFVLS